jgi:hypothetical protein
MTKLSTAKRKKIPKSEFGEPGKKKYPMEDKSHARNAKARASEMEHKGKMSKKEEKKIDNKANRVIGHRTLSGHRK